MISDQSDANMSNMQEFQEPKIPQSRFDHKLGDATNSLVYRKTLESLTKLKSQLILWSLCCNLK